MKALGCCCPVRYSRPQHVRSPNFCSPNECRRMIVKTYLPSFWIPRMAPSMKPKTGFWAVTHTRVPVGVWGELGERLSSSWVMKLSREWSSSRMGDDGSSTFVLPVALSGKSPLSEDRSSSRIGDDVCSTFPLCVVLSCKRPTIRKARAWI